MKKVKSLAVLLLLTAFIAFCLLFVIPALQKIPPTKSATTQPIILTLWHVESFEGGVGNRGEWLKKRALEFEKKYRGVYVDVQKFTPAQLSQKIKEGQPFDLVSFGAGVGYDLLGHLSPISGDGLEIFDNLLNSATISGESYALPYSSGGYLLAGRQSDLPTAITPTQLTSDPFAFAVTKKAGKNQIELKSVIAGSSSYCIPALALALLADKKQNCSVYFSKEVTQYGAYERFLKGNTATVLLGSQRDYWRISNRQKTGKIGEIIYSVAGNYTDLTQFVALGRSGEAEREVLSKRFIEHLLSKKSQSTLSSVGMLSVTLRDLYEGDEIISQLQKNLPQVACLNAFTSIATLEQAEKEALQALQTGDPSVLKKYTA